MMPSTCTPPSSAAAGQHRGGTPARHRGGDRSRHPGIAARLALALALGVSGVAQAERSLHGSIGGGGSLLVTGARGDHLRFDLALDVKPWSRHGIGLAWRAFDRDHRGLVMIGWNYEGAAARPRLVVDLHADAGADLDARAPVIGGGVRATVAIVGPLGVVLDAGGYLVIDGIDDSRLQIQSSTLLVLRW